MEDAIQKSGDYSDNEVFDDSVLAANFENSFFKDKSLNKSDINNDLTLSALSSDIEIIGYDKEAGKTWIYPTNYPIRDYQFNIIKAAILKNTLVSLPTGLGKTFIAAVIMLNFYRWYPMGKIIFTAPTKPLVAQQIDACYNIVAIPPSDTVEMTGHMQVNTRKTQWETKRVFFATPHVIENDIKSGICPGDKICCLVIDEAHKARGKYAYCNIISELTNIGHSYRILALSATPGSKVEDVIAIIKNLNIAHLELRTDTSKDVEPYCHTREINTVIVQLGPELTNLRNQYVEILDVYARRLKQLNILPLNVGNLSKGRIVMMYKEFQNVGMERGARHPSHNYIMKDFTILIALYHGLELLVKHGLRIFLNFFDEHSEKTWIQSDQKLMAFLENLRNDLGINPLSLDTSILPDGTVPEIPKNLKFGHPKFDKLKEIMLQHFNEAKQQGEETKAIVFCEFRESVNLVHCLLLQCRPLIVPQMFVGQAASGKKAGVSQKEQARALRGFRAGASNALVCTCVAEEGLDVGAVDLILCFDVSTRSPVRLVQRCGRTGRSRRGHVYILVTEGREHQVLLDSMRQRDGLNFSVLKSKQVEDSLYKNNPRMLPPGTFPDCHKTFIKVNKKGTTEETTTKSKKGQKDLRAMLVDKGPGTSKTDHKELLTKDEFEELRAGSSQAAYFPPAREYWAMSGEKLLTIRSDSKINLSTWLDNQRSLQTTALVGHSADTKILVKLLNNNKEDVPLADSQGSYPASLTPNVFLSPAKNKVKKKLKNPLVKSPFKKDGDIRALFSTNTKSTKSYTKHINELGIHNDGRIPTKLINIFVDLSVENKNMNKTCWTCHNICDCKIIQRMRNERNVPFFLPVNSEPYLPSISMIDDFDINFLIEYDKTLLNNTSKDCDINNVDDKNKEVIENKLTSKCVLVSDEENNINNTEPNRNAAINFDIGDVEDIFADSSSEDMFANDVIEQTDFEPQTKDATKKDDNGIGFFHLNSIEDLFEDSGSEADINKDTIVKSPDAKTSVCKTFDVKPVECDVQTINDRDNNQNVYPTSPSILSGKSIKNSAPTSPILCSQTRKLNLSIKKNIRSSTPNSAKKHLDMNKPPDVKASPKQISESSEHFKDMSSKNTIIQTIDYKNRKKDNSKIDLSSSHRTLNESIGVHENERSSSPILLTQRDRRKNSHTIDSRALKTSQTKTSIINLDSDSDSDFEINTQEHKKIVKEKTSKIKARASPYFNKELKLSNDLNESTTLQEKILAVLTSNKFNNDPLGDKDSHVNFMVKSPHPKFGKENKHNLEKLKEEKDNYGTKNNVTKLQMYEYDINFKQSPLKEKCNNGIKSNIKKLQIYRRDSSETNTSTPVNGMKRKLTFSDSDDDFETSQPRNKRVAIDVRLPSQKMRKKKKKYKNNNEFLELEAELSGDASSSGDELSDDSAGSIRGFICDDSAALHENVDMHAHYLKSVTSPVKGVFKIPQLPDKFNKREILSQTWVENDTYEMDSFCVDDSNIELTQANEMSELELAEMILEERRRKKRSSKHMTESQANGDSPLIRKKFRTVTKRIDSDSDDSS